MNPTPATSHLLPRLATAALSQAARVMPIVVVMGSRQTGKSTLVRMHPTIGQYPYHTLDHAETRLRAADDPAGFLANAPPLILDEVQRAPDLVIALKAAVDAQPRRVPGQFIVTGSANLLDLKKVKETLAGRAVYTTLWPMTRRERLGFGSAGVWDALRATDPTGWPALLEAQVAPAADWRAEVRRSGYPDPALSMPDPEDQAVWLQGYVDTYLDRDVRELASGLNTLEYYRLMRHVCLAVGRIENQTTWARNTRLTAMTVGRYLDLLERSFQLVRVPGFAVNRTKRLTKSAKVYWSDTALALHLAGETEPTGLHLENLVLTDLLAWRSTLRQPPAIMHWRTQDQKYEVDFVLEFADGTLLPIESKSTGRPGYSDTASLREFLKAYPKATAGLILHGGDQIDWLAPNILAAPWWRVL